MNHDQSPKVPYSAPKLIRVDHPGIDGKSPTTSGEGITFPPNPTAYGTFTGS